jgi:hypothetical protein
LVLRRLSINVNWLAWSDPGAPGAKYPGAKYIPDIETALGHALEEIKENHSALRLRELIDDHWRAFTNVARNHNKENRLTRNVYRVVFANAVERNLLEYPVDASGYPRLLEYLSPEKHLIILTSKGAIINVRTVDKVAREIARINVLASIKANPNNTLNADSGNSPAAG